MKLLLDTHTFLWFVRNDANLSAAALTLILDPNNDAYLSPVTYWEIGVKISVGKLALGGPFAAFMARSLQRHPFTLLPVEMRHCAELATLPLHHRDPFDRLLIAQAIVESMPMLSADAAFDAYPIIRHW